MGMLVWMGVYSSALAVGLVLSAPWWLWRMATSGKYRAGLSGRLGLVPAGLKEAVAGKNVVWVHAVSVGEVLGAARLIGELREALPGWVVAVSTTTATGQKIAQERLSGVPVFYLPLDFGWAVRAYLRVLKPKMLVLMESELWPRLLVECERAGVPVAVVNARVSDRSFPRYMRLRWLWRPLLGRVSVFLAQGEETARRLVAIGAPAERVRVVGNLKFDLREVGENAVAAQIGRLLNGKKLIVAGSTLPGEEKMLLAAWARVVEREPEIVMVIAPRHPERFGEVEMLLEQWPDQVFTADEIGTIFDGEVEGRAIILLNTLGDLATVYGLADVAFLGGSLVAKGGHNPLEAARFGVPVVMGASHENFREMVEGMKAAGAIRIVGEGEVAEVLVELLRDDGGMGERGRVFFEGQAGATGRTVTELVGMLWVKA